MQNPLNINNYDLARQPDNRIVDAEDAKKLHGVVNQVDHQQFLITSAAISVFAIAFGWVLNGVRQGTVPIAASAGIGILVQSLLFTLWVKARLIRKMMRNYTVYLRLTGLSDWEKDWVAFREEDSRHSLSTRLSSRDVYYQQAAFFILILLAAAVPWLLHFRYEPSVSSSWSRPLLWSLLFVGIMNVALLVVKWGRESTDDEKAIEQCWLVALEKFGRLRRKTETETPKP